MRAWAGPALLVLALLAGCGPTATERAAPVARQIVTTDGEVRQVEERPVAGAPGIDEATARSRSVEHGPGAARASAVEARFVALTMATDREVWNFQSRSVWLITYLGVPFVAENCAGRGGQELADTVVVLDGRDGEFVLVYGVGDRAGGLGLAEHVNRRARPWLTPGA